MHSLRAPITRRSTAGIRPHRLRVLKCTEGPGSHQDRLNKGYCFRGLVLACSLRNSAPQYISINSRTWHAAAPKLNCDFFVCRVMSEGSIWIHFIAIMTTYQSYYSKNSKQSPGRVCRMPGPQAEEPYPFPASRFKGQRNQKHSKTFEKKIDTTISGLGFRASRG